MHRILTTNMVNSAEMSSRSKMVLVLMVVVINYLTIVATQSTAVVSTTSGPVRGQIRNSVNSVKYASFKGMRFAKPPLGYLRFKPPVPIEPWTEILNATDEGSECTQMNPLSKVYSGNEDCLFINVDTPVTNLATIPTNLKPVMVWIHGGGFAMGSSSTKSLGPDYIVEKGVVFVAMNYRLGPLGFLGMGHPNATGNAGLKDQVLGLKWVKANIKRFGGNPNNVTIIGQSAGSASIGYLVLSDAAAGLFHGAISMSGVPLNPWAFQSPAVALKQSVKLGALLGTVSTDKDTLLKAFYKATPQQLANASSNIVLMGLLPFTPTLEDRKIATDVFLTTCSVVKYITGNYSKVPQMLGFTNRELLQIATAVKPFLDVMADALRAIDTFGTTLPGHISAVSQVINATTNVPAVLADNIIEAVINETSDVLFVVGIDQTQRLLSANNNNKDVFYYRVSHDLDELPNVVNPHTNHTYKGVGHAEDLFYLFYAPAMNFSTNPTNPTRRTINRVTTMWTNFVKYGNPTPSWIHDDILNVTWPNSGLSGRALDIGTELKVVPRPISDFAKVVQLLSWPTLGSANGCF